MGANKRGARTEKGRLSDRGRKRKREREREKNTGRTETL